ncbi:head-tail connector protein [Velocimicrobium porci]|uniref:Phage gp6-like head-tail connector protein n=1 Tax=Velocimicrobium porci TaxID=2606634 RepID=A0A6L5XWG5_9FIRM|nr:head-tail connector protein [Velocimicrobium porci]MSS63176.1 phage gp6-like head-tail connector protein [Velocimicrobium porci]
MKVSEINTDYLSTYLKLDDPEEETIQELEVMKMAAVELVKSYTGLTETEIEEHEDITIAALVLIGDMYDNRNMYLDYKNTKLNKTVMLILDMYSVNLL